MTRRGHIPLGPSPAPRAVRGYRSAPNIPAFTRYHQSDGTGRKGPAVPEIRTIIPAEVERQLRERVKDGHRYTLTGLVRRVVYRAAGLPEEAAVIRQGRPPRREANS